MQNTPLVLDLLAILLTVCSLPAIAVCDHAKKCHKIKFCNADADREILMPTLPIDFQRNSN